MCDQGEKEVVTVLHETQRRIDHRLKRVFDAETRGILQQAQVHIHEALLLLGCDFAGDSGRGCGVSFEPGVQRASQQELTGAGDCDAGCELDRVPDHPDHQPAGCQGRNGAARYPVRPFELRLAYSQDDDPGNG